MRLPSTTVELIRALQHVGDHLANRGQGAKSATCHRAALRLEELALLLEELAPIVDARKVGRLALAEKDPES